MFAIIDYMTTGKRKHVQECTFLMADDLPRAPTVPFYDQLNRLLARVGFETFVEQTCRRLQDRDSSDQINMLERSDRLHLASELRHAPQRLAAVVTCEAMLGVRSWITLTPKNPEERQGRLCASG